MNLPYPKRKGSWCWLNQNKARPAYARIVEAGGRKGKMKLGKRVREKKQLEKGKNRPLETAPLPFRKQNE